MAMACGVVESELGFKYGIEGEKLIRIILLTINVMITVILFFSLYLTYQFTLNLKKMKGLASKYDDLISTGAWMPLCFEWIFSILTPMPWFWNITW